MTTTIKIGTEHYGRHYETVTLPAPADCAGLDYEDTARRLLARLPRDTGLVALSTSAVARRLRTAVEVYLGAAEHDSDVIAAVVQDGPGYRAVVTYTATGRDVPRDRTEGGTYHGGGSYPHLAAAEEAEARARRTGRPVRRVGYVEADVVGGE